MKLFESIFGDKKMNAAPGAIYAPVDGTLHPMEEIPDPVFAKGMLGQGCGIDPIRNTVYAPVDGTVVSLAKTLHAIGIATDDDAELLIHVGMDTVNMKGQGFRALIKQGDKVSCGQKLLRFDRSAIEAAGYSPMIGFTVMNADDLNKVTFQTEGAVKAKTEIGRYEV